MDVQRNSEPTRRPYRMRARRESIEATRARIAEAAYELHATVGPARTTISSIADRAGVQRHTVYAHFPDLTSLFQACTAHSMAVDGPPDPEAWRQIADPAERLRVGLGEVYDYYRRNARLVGNVARDLPLLPPDAYEGTRAYVDLGAAMFQALADGFDVDATRHPTLEVALRHALDFGTWQSLTSTGLTDADARDAMTSFVTLMAGRPTESSAA